MIPDAQERATAIQVNRSFAVTAPAGSGKTGLLTQRVLNLLGHVEQPEQILSITFTRKAAKEMRDRILAALEAAALQQSSDDPHQQKTLELAQRALQRDQTQGWQLLANPHRLNINTIDGFCAQLAKSLPITAGIGGHLAISEAPERLYEIAIQRTLEHIESDTDVARGLQTIMQHLDTDTLRLERLLTHILVSREQWLRLLVHRRDDLSAFREQLHYSLRQITSESLQRLTTLLSPWGHELVELSHCAAAQLGTQATRSDENKSGVGLPETTPENLRQWRQLTQWLLTKDGHWRRSLTKNQGFPSASREPDKSAFKQVKQRANALIAELSEQPGVLPALQELNALPDAHFSEQQWSFMAALCTLLPNLVAELMLVFRDQGEVDFTQIMAAAVSALGSDEQPTDLALILDHRINHILVDEFQDTSSAQFYLLSRLTENWEKNDGRTLFLVGDGMQSCYGFRDANVGLFQVARERGIGAVQLEALSLRTNFRSSNGVVDWVNQTFSQAFPKFDDVGQGAVSYRSSTALKPSDTREPTELILCTDDDRGSEAHQVVQLVQETLRQSSTDSIAVLVRNRHHLDNIIQKFRDSGIGWQALEIDPLLQRPIISDLLALTKAMCNPADEIAWTAVLRAPWCGLQLIDLQQIISPSASGLSSIWQRLQSMTSLLSDDGQDRVAHLVQSLTPLIAHRDRFALRDWISACWLALHGANQAYPEGDLPLVEDYLSLLEQHSLTGYTIDPDEFEQQLTKHFAAHTDTRNDRVQIMTMHKAKGLEFDHVILPGLDRSNRSSVNPIFIWHEQVTQDGDAHLLISPIAAKAQQQDNLFEFLKRAEKLKSSHEEVRLLYVACTRAVKRLSLVACARLNEDGKPTAPAQGSMLSRIWPFVSDQAKPVIAAAKTENTRTPEATLARLSIQHLNLLP